MRPAFKYSLIPVLAAAATTFAVLPHRGADATVRIVARGEGFAFVPAEVQIQPGQRIAFRNDSKVTHTATCDGCPWTSRDVQPGQTRFVTFPTALRTTYRCAYHAEDQAFTGQVTVGSPPAPEATPSP